MKLCLFPAILNLASNAHISTNATCGEKGPEMFCKLVEHVPGRPLRNAQCRICDHNKQHPISNAIDGTNNWWQSPSIQNGREYHWVTITLDLRQVFQVAYIIIKAANAPRPGNWILERSVDGTEFRPWQYYAISDTECLTRYNVTPRLGPPTYKRDDEVICTSYYSRLVPLEHGEIHTSLINGRPSADDPSEKLLEFTSARYIRLRLQRIRTLNADLMTLSHHDPKDVDPIVTRRYYYSIKDISVGGMCICYGHARSCPLDNETKVSPYDNNPCLPCECDLFGSFGSDCIKDDDHADPQHGVQAGQCHCKDGYTGEKCDRCAFGYKGYPNCMRCNCSLVGSINDDPCTEPCLCKLTSFGGYLKYTVSYDIPMDSTDSDLVSNVDVMIQGNGQMLATRAEGLSLQPYEEYSSSVRLVSENFVDFNTKKSIDRDTLMTVLANITDILLRASYNVAKRAVYRLDSVILDTANVNLVNASSAADVEYCECPQGYSGISCESCLPGYYRVDGILFGGICLQCDCNGHATECDVHGVCLFGYYGLSTGLGCLPCNCSKAGSVAEDCDDEGQCRCVPGVAGEKCDRCAHGFYAFQDGGCTPCNCAHTLDICDEDSGECICPSHTEGEKCELCEENFWGLDPEKGCKACNCSDLGSVSLQCDQLTAQCQCKHGYGGASCDECALGYRDYPDCVPCDCDLRGSKANTCDQSQGICSCEEETGVCVCKENVFGLHCSECKFGTFALHAINPLGCIPCFCSGRSEFCTEVEDYVRVSVTLTPQQSVMYVVSQSNLTGTSEGVFSQYPDILMDATTVRQHLNMEPFYWKLPHQFQGDQLMAYGGKLKYSVAFYALDGIGTSNLEPQILMKGGHTSKYVIYVDIPAPENGSAWKYFNSVSDESVSHSDFMSVISNVSMEIAVKADDAPFASDTALHIEKCLCPVGYAGLSCQDCAPGYYREEHTGVHLKYSSCVPCQCNNHSDTCDPKTGKCLDCKDNTVGDHCSLCAPGFYGKVTGSVNDCSLCACPRTSSGSSTCVLKGVNDFHCDACIIGYEGQYCERCSPTYYGDPKSPGGSCQQCQCNPNGSVHNNCDHISGQCVCKQGVAGWLCDECEPRHILVDNECICESTRTLGRGKHLSNDTEKTLNKSQELTIFISTLQESVKALIEVAASVSETLGTDFPLSNRTLQELQDEIPIMLDVMRGRRFKHLHQNSTLELKAAERLLTRIQKEYWRPQQELKNLQKTVKRIFSDHSTNLQEAKNVVNEASANINETNRLLFLINSNLKECNVRKPANKKINIQENQELSVVLTREGKVQVDAAATIAKDVINSTSSLEIQWDGLMLWNGKLRQHVDDLVKQISTRGALDLVYRTEDHAASLQRIVHALDNGLLNVRNVSLNATNAVHAYSTIKSLIGNAESLAGDAYRTVTESVHVPKESFNSTEKNVLQPSSKLLTEAKSLHNKYEGLVSGVYNMNIKVGKFKEQANRIAKQFNDSLLQLNALPNDTSENILAVKILAVSANITAVSGLSHTGCFSEKLMNTSSALSEVNETLQKTNELIIDSSKAAESAERKVNEVEIQAGLLFGRLKPLKVLEENLSRNISEIKELISQARKQAASIKVAVSAERDYCMPEKSQQPDDKVAMFGKTGTLTVEETNSLQKPFMRTATSPGTATVLDIDQSSLMFIGGLGGQIKDEDISFHFDGSGYSLVEKALRSTVTQIILFFSTFSPNGLLVYLASNGTKDFLSLELVDGKVKLMVDLGSGPLTLKTESRYNNGTWYKISFSRNKKEGILAVMDAYNLSSKETKQGESPGVASDLNRSDRDPIYIGGLPRSRTVRKGLSTRTYVGCIKNLEISRSTFDLLKNSYGVRKGCILEPIYSTSVLNRGYIELPPKPLSPDSQLMATFVTKNTSGIILMGLSKGAEKRRRRQAHLPFFSIMLVNGHLAVHVNAGDRASTRKVLVAPDNGTYSDGQEHSVILTRNKRTITVQVDESSSAEIRLGPLAETRPINMSHLFVGGIPVGEGISGLKMNDSFYGCITNLIFNMEFSVQLNLRTFASNGLIYYMAHQKQIDYAALQLQGGKLYFSFDLGKGRAIAFHGAIISDGKWHTVKTEYAKKKGIIIVDGQEPVTVNIPGDGNTLDVDGKLYLGGLPFDYSTKNIGNVTHSIPACIGGITINNKEVDKDNPVSIFSVNKCYVTAQEGTFFDGSGFLALVKHGYKVRSDVNITFEFRTTIANGVLLGISSAKVDAVGLELVNGKILFNINNGAGRVTATYAPKGTTSLCDGQWHKLQANKSKHHIALIVDGNLVHTDNPHMHSTSADTNNPIYVGGYPADVKQNCLTSKSSFRGCLRNLMLIKGQQAESFDFSEAFDLRGVFPHSCPGAEH
ncbi:hypothetical protein JD844_016413 [Phrynosoma platyrhinos]|uniref:Laminin subunit alpha 1 n=1 Tax=Phrynosoma platyrhinos TaxID=52577 RepID=A0ABQ7SKG4_PHRPL|nr:hypothetical protein JD844_016413 [Phrynosoma platyrhinos]